MKRNLKIVLFAVSVILLIVFAPFYSLVFAAILLPIVEALLEESAPENILFIFMMSFISNIVMITLLIPILWKLYIKGE